MERVKTFVNGGREYPADLNAIQDRAAEMLEGTTAELPSSHFAGRLFRAIDTGIVYVDSSSVWTPVATLAIKTTAVEITAKAGELIEVTASVTINLPKAPATNTVIGVFSRSGVLVKTTSGEKIVGGALPETGTSVTVNNGEYVLVQYDGTRYLIIGGTPSGYIGGEQLGGGTVRQELVATQSFLSWGMISEIASIEASTGDFTITKPGTGEYEVTFTKEKSSANYAVLPVTRLLVGLAEASNQTTKTFKIKTGQVAEPGQVNLKNMAFSFMVLAAS